MLSINENEVKLNKLKGRSYKLLAARDILGCNNLCMGISFFPPREHAPGHIHKTEEEVVFCLEGHGELVIDGVAEKLIPGTAVFMPPGSLHSVNNTGDETIKLVFVFSPSIKIGDYKDHDNR